MGLNLKLKVVEEPKESKPRPWKGSKRLFETGEGRARTMLE